MKSFDQAGVYAAKVHVAEAKSRPWLWVVVWGGLHSRSCFARCWSIPLI